MKIFTKYYIQTLLVIVAVGLFYNILFSTTQTKTKNVKSETVKITTLYNGLSAPNCYLIEFQGSKYLAVNNVGIVKLEQKAEKEAE